MPDKEFFCSTPRKIMTLWVYHGIENGTLKSRQAKEQQYRASAQKLFTKFAIKDERKNGSNSTA